MLPNLSGVLRWRLREECLVDWHGLLGRCRQRKMSELLIGRVNASITSMLHLIKKNYSSLLNFNNKGLQVIEYTFLK